MLIPSNGAKVVVLCQKHHDINSRIVIVVISTITVFYLFIIINIIVFHYLFIFNICFMYSFLNHYLSLELLFFIIYF